MSLPLILAGAGIMAVLNYRRDRFGREGENIDVSTLNRLNLKGMVVSCGVFGVFQHTGIWTDRGIVELKGNGLVRIISPERFLQQRSGNGIFIACNNQNIPLSDPLIEANALLQVMHYMNYDLNHNNCYRFVCQCLSEEHHVTASFKQFEQKLEEHFSQEIYWSPLMTEGHSSFI